MLLRTNTVCFRSELMFLGQWDIQAGESEECVWDFGDAAAGGRFRGGLPHGLRCL